MFKLKLNYSYIAGNKIYNNDIIESRHSIYIILRNIDKYLNKCTIGEL